MSTTYTTSSTFTRTNARYLASKVAADLRQMRLFYGRPSDGEIDDYNTELIELLVGGYLDSVDYVATIRGWLRLVIQYRTGRS